MKSNTLKLIIMLAALFSLCYLAELNKQEALRKQAQLRPIQTQQDLLAKQLVQPFSMDCTPSNSITWSM